MSGSTFLCDRCGSWIPQCVDETIVVECQCKPYEVRLEGQQTAQTIWALAATWEQGDARAAELAVEREDASRALALQCGERIAFVGEKPFRVRCSVKPVYAAVAVGVYAPDSNTKAGAQEQLLRQAALDAAPVVDCQCYDPFRFGHLDECPFHERGEP